MFPFCGEGEEARALSRGGRGIDTYPCAPEESRPPPVPAPLRGGSSLALPGPLDVTGPQRALQGLATAPGAPKAIGDQPSDTHGALLSLWAAQMDHGLPHPPVKSPRLPAALNPHRRHLDLADTLSISSK